MDDRKNLPLHETLSIASHPHPRPNLGNLQKRNCFTVSGDTLLTKKPDLAVIKSCIQAFGLPPHRMLFVGESSIGVTTARNAGINVGALPYGYNKRPAD